MNQLLGPPDGTIVVQIDKKCDELENIFEDNFMHTLVQNLSELGEIIFVRCVDNSFWITFRNGQSALAAVEKRFTIVCGKKLKITLKSPDWILNFKKNHNLGNIDDKEKHCVLSTDIKNVEMLDSNAELCSATSSSLKLTPPVRPPQPMTSKIVNNSNVTLLQTKQLNTTSDISQKTFSSIPIADSISKSELISVNLQPSTLSKPFQISPPPLPLRQQPLPPPRIPPPLPPMTLPPPIPARSCEGPPIPARNKN
jgi:hypothetical protein